MKSLTSESAGDIYVLDEVVLLWHALVGSPLRVAVPRS